MILKLKNWFKKEGGVSEATTAIFVLPLVVALIFLVVEAGFNIRTRVMVDNLVQDTTRSAALEGGWNNLRATSLPSGKTWASVGTERIQEACRTGTIRSKTPCNSLSIICTTPAVANYAGDAVTCRLGTPITYATLSPLSTNPLFSYGFQGVFTTPITSSVTSSAAIGRY